MLAANKTPEERMELYLRLFKIFMVILDALSENWNR